MAHFQVVYNLTNGASEVEIIEAEDPSAASLIIANKLDTNIIKFHNPVNTAHTIIVTAHVCSCYVSLEKSPEL